MAPVLTFYFSRIIGKKVYSALNDKPIGKISDLIVEIGSVRPKVVAAKINIKNSLRIVDFSYITINKQEGQYFIKCHELIDVNPEKDKTFYLGKNVQDRQLVDIDGRKLVRVNDLRLAVVNDGTFLIAVDVGFEGLLRRLGAAKPLKSLLKPFRIGIPSHLILWDEVETVGFGHAGIKLSKEHSKFAKLHPSDLADILEDMDRKTQISVFETLDVERAADVLEELEPDAQKNLIENMSVEKAADLLEKMPPDEAADLLDELHEAKAEELLSEMKDETSEEIMELMDYPEDSVGSLMSTDYISFNKNYTVNHTITELRKVKPESDCIYYLYVVNDENKLIGTVSLRDIVISEPDIKLEEIMNKNIVFTYAHDEIDALNEIIAKYSLLAVPVVDNEKKMLGMVIINDVVYNLLRAKRKRL